ncbi:mechanosensitive ion channel family protein [Ornithinicoccus hortensis]|nr:mechanosensitive ion channel family protein [Ornithinicoccus hortensis]
MPFRTWEEFGAWLLGAPLRVLLILLIALLVRWLLFRAIRQVEESAMEKVDSRRLSKVDQVWAGVTGTDLERRKQRTLTLGSLLRSISTLIIFTIALLTILAEFGVPLGPMLASAGVGGVALGFGAQSLVKDFLSGIFMIIEDQYGVGDVVDTGEAVGTVEEVGLRITRLRDAQGVVWFIRNGEIVRIGNQSQGWAVATVDLPVAATTEPADALPVLRRVAEQMYADQDWADKLMEAPSVAGVESVTAGTMTLRMFVKTLPGEQWATSRALRARALAALKAEGIKEPGYGLYGPQPPEG